MKAPDAETQRLNKVWSTLFREAIDRRAAQQIEKAGTPVVSLGSELRQYGITPDEIKSWRDGVAYPDFDQHDFLLAHLPLDEEQSHAMREARAAVVRAKAGVIAKAAQRPRLGPSSGGGALTIRKDREAPVLKALRVDQSNTAYEDMVPTERAKILQTIQERLRNGGAASAAEYLYCYRLNRNIGRTVAAGYLEVNRSQLMTWETGLELPENETLNRFDLLLNGETLGEFKGLETSNRKLLMLAALQEKEYPEFGQYLAKMPQDFYVEELKRYLKNAKSIILSKGVYYYCLRRVAGHDYSGLSHATELSEAYIRSLENDNKTASSEALGRRKLQEYLEGKISEQDSEIAGLLKQLDVRGRIDTLPIARPRKKEEDIVQEEGRRR